MDIKHVARPEEVVQKVITNYSILTCRKCKFQEEVKGTVTTNCLPRNWGALTISSLGQCSVFEWLLCPTCIEEVRKTAGL